MSLGGFWKNSKRTATGDLVGLGVDTAVEEIRILRCSTSIAILTGKGPWLLRVRVDVSREHTERKSHDGVWAEDDSLSPGSTQP